MRFQSGVRRHIADKITELKLPPIVREIQRRRLTYLSSEKFLSLAKAIRQTRRDALEGDFVEYGIALGGSGVYLASQIRGTQRFIGFDVFGTIPAPSDRDEEDSRSRYEVIRSGKSNGIEHDTYYGYLDDLFDRVCDTFEHFGYPVDGTRIVLNRGLFEQSVQFKPDDRVALAHVDCDWFDPVKLCLERTAQVLCPLGVMILDDYNDYDGCRKAVDQFLAANSNYDLVRNVPHAVIQKRAANVA